MRTSPAAGVLLLVLGVWLLLNVLVGDLVGKARSWAVR